MNAASQSFDLNAILVGGVFTTLLLVCRFGSALMILPGLGDMTVPTPIRLLFVVAFSALMAPLLARFMPAEPASPIGMMVLVLSEVMVGLFLGMTARLFFTALEVAGTIAAQQSSLANAMLFNPQMGATGTLPSAILSAAGVTLFFVTNMHHIVLRGLAESYVLLPAGQGLQFDLFSAEIIRMFSQMFMLGVQISAPFLLVGLILSLAMGLIARLTPQIQIFFLAMPIQITLGFLVFIAAIATMLGVWHQATQAALTTSFGQ